MRRALPLLVTFLFAIMSMSNSVALPAVESNNGPVFGGQHSAVANQSTQSAEISSLPAIAEDFTATWCENCVKAEAALDELESEGLLTKYEFHVATDLDDSGFLRPEVTSHLESRYGYQRGPPLVAINGIMTKNGVVPDSDSLVSDYRNMMDAQLNLVDATSSFTWTPSAYCECDLGDNMGIISWSLEANLSAYPEGILNVNAWIVEQSTEFNGGSNGKNIYHDLVRTIIDLGNDPQGSANITIPNAYDGDDLEIHLVYIVDIPDPVDEDPTPITEDETNSNRLPGFTLSLVICAILGAVVYTRKS